MTAFEGMPIKHCLCEANCERLVVKDCLYVNIRQTPSISPGGGGGPGQRCVDSKNSQTTPATTSTSSIRQLLGAGDASTAHDATFSTVPTHQLLGSANAETTPARAPAAAADRKQRPDATCEGKTG